MNIIQDKIRGCLIGGAVGDALGYPIEFMRGRSIVKQYGEKGITEYELDRKTGKAVISDDTQMTMFTANGFLLADTRAALEGQTECPPRKEIARAYQDWLVTQELSYEDFERRHKADLRGGSSWLLDVPELFEQRAPGNTCLFALRCLKNGGDRKEDYIREPQNSSKGCGGVMRVAPMGLSDRLPIEALDFEGAQLAAITHGHSLGYMPAAVLTHIVHRLVFGEKDLSLKEIVLEAKETAEKVFAGDKHLEEHSALIMKAVELSENGEGDLSNIRALGEGWVADEALAIALYCALRHQDDFSAGIIASVNHSGDSDSTGAIAGNILGALHGFEAIEEKWKKDLELLDEIIELSDDLFRLCQCNERRPFRDPDWIGKYGSRLRPVD